MTDHGVPSTTGKNGGSLLAGNSTPSAQAAAERACQKLLPADGALQKLTDAQRTAWLRYSACMRAHGVLDYPDPKFVDDDTGVILDGRGLDFHSPIFQAASAACRDVFPLSKLRG
jgi:hypothetical protein